MTFLYCADPERGSEWEALFSERAPEIGFDYRMEAVDPLSVRYLGVWQPMDGMAERFPNVEVLFSLGAGIDQFDLDALPAHWQLVRMIEPGISEAMAEYVTLAVLALRRNLIAYRHQQTHGEWQALRFRPAGRLRVGLLGTGVLARAAMTALAPFGFALRAWSRSRQSINGVTSFAGAGELDAFLGETDILVCLLPLTPETTGILNGALFSKLPPGAALINCGRGSHLVQADLLNALDDGRLSAAVLDVTEPEPLPADHPLRRHDKVLITPHIASMTQPETAVDVVIDNIRRHRAGRPMTGSVDRRRGY